MNQSRLAYSLDQVSARVAGMLHLRHAGKRAICTAARQGAADSVAQRAVALLAKEVPH